MRKGVAHELTMLRIIGFNFLSRHTCMLCNKVLTDPADIRDGNGRRGHPIKIEFTEHHIDGNHENQALENRAIVHRTCHKSYHMWLRYQETHNLKSTYTKWYQYQKEIQNGSQKDVATAKAKVGRGRRVSK